MGDRDNPASLLTRRAFFGIVGNGIGVVVLGGLIRSLEPNDIKFSRPPGAVIEEEFLSLCIRCDKCIDVCPYGLVSRVLITESLVAAGTPVIRGQMCPSCRRCIPFCPTGALVRTRI